MSDFLLQIKNKSASKLEEVIEFYNRYLEIGNYDEFYILNLIEELSNIFISKVNNTNIFANLGSSLIFQELLFNENDLKDLSLFSKSIISFSHGDSIFLDFGGIAYVDRFGSIVYVDNATVLQQSNCKNILTFAKELDLCLAKTQANNFIMQNILCSKVFNAVKEKIEATSGVFYAGLFQLIYASVLKYEEMLEAKNVLFEDVTCEFKRVRSSR